LPLCVWYICCIHFPSLCILFTTHSFSCNSISVSVRTEILDFIYTHTCKSLDHDIPWSFTYPFKWTWNTLGLSLVGTQFLTLRITLNPWLILFGCCLAAVTAGACIKCELFLTMVCGLPV
jgi:hypothetical protein